VRRHIVERGRQVEALMLRALRAVDAYADVTPPYDDAHVALRHARGTARLRARSDDGALPRIVCAMLRRDSDIAPRRDTPRCYYIIWQRSMREAGMVRCVREW